MTMPPPQTILLIGAGLGGLAFAQILRHSPMAEKYKVLIFERDATPTDRGQGYQIGINQSGLSFLSAIPHISSVLETEHKCYAASIVDGELKVMLQLKNVPVPDGMAGLVNRWKLRNALAEGLQVEWGKRFVRYEETETLVIAHFEDGTHVSGDLLIGADGAKSRVRGQRCPYLKLEELPVVSTAGSIAITPAIRDKIPRVIELAEESFIVRVVAPEGNSVLVMIYESPDGDTRLIWSLSFPATSSSELPSESSGLKQAIDNRATILGGELASLIQETTIENYIFDAAPRSLLSVVPMNENPFGKTSRVTLLGDAAHAMTTHRGLGANTAFADASDLVQALTNENDFWKALANYERKMLQRGFEAIKMSKQSTEMIHLAGMKSVLRNAVIRGIGCILWVKQLFS